MSSRPSPLPHAALSPITVPVVPWPCFQSMWTMLVPPTSTPTCSTAQNTESGSRAILSRNSFSASSEGGFWILRKRVTSRSSNQVIIKAASSGRGGRSLTSVPSSTGPYMTRRLLRSPRVPANAPLPPISSPRAPALTWKALGNLAGCVQLGRFLHVHRDGWPLHRRQEERAQVLAFRCRRLIADQRVDERRQVLVQLLGVERDLADRDVDDPELVSAELDLAALGLAHGACNVIRDGARLRVRHQSSGTEDLAERSDLGHHVRRRDRGVEVRPALLHTLHQIVAADHVRARLLRLARPVAHREDGDAHLFACAVGQDHRSADHLLGVTRVDAQANMSLDGGIELRDRGVAHDLARGLGLETAVAVAADSRLDLLGRL